MSESWLSPTPLRPSTWRRRFLTGASLLSGFVALVLALAATRAAGDDSPASWFAWPAWLLTGTFSACVATWAAALAARTRATAAALLQIDARGVIRLDAAPAEPLYAGSMLVALRVGPRAGSRLARRFTGASVDGATLLVWCDSLPRVGFRRLVVAARWGATPASV